MRTTERRAAFPRFLSLALLAAVLIGWLSPATAALAQVPPKIPGLPGFGKPAAAIEEPPLFNDSRDRVDTTVAVSQPTVAAGGDVAIAVIFELDDHWHIWPKPGPIEGGLAEFGSSIRTEIALAEGFDAKSLPLTLHLGFAQWPAPVGVEFDLGDGMLKYAVHEGVARVFIPASVAADAKAGTYEIPLTATFQACDDTGCLRPVTVDIPVRIEVGTPAANAAASAAFTGFDPSVYARIRAGEKPSEILEFNLFSWKFSIDPRGPGMLLLLLIAAAGGFILNFTPCVLPVIPLKIMGLAQAAQGSRAKCFALGFTMSLGVVAFWMVLGTLMATVQGFTSANQLFQMPWFTILVGVVIATMAIGMAGFFSINLPNWVYMVEAKHDSYGGSFVFGIMTAVLSTPCTAPLMGTAVAWSTTQGVGTILTVFAAVGIGMALPYLVLSAYPNLVDRMPRTGPASDLIKQVMGLLLLAAGAYFAGAGLSGLLVTPPEPPSKAYWWVVALLGAAAGAWLLVRTVKLTRKPFNLAFFGGLGAAILGISVLIGLSQTAKGPVDWTYYTPERLEEARAEGKVVVVDFTAEWCANCKTLEALVLNLPSVSKELNADDVASIKVDLTGNNEAGNALLKASNRVTIPLLLVYGRDGKVVLNASDYTPQQVLDAIAEARGKEASRGE
ncbi:MAG: thioredoxin family protein [Planctomycetaceae bacterium]|nr:thioredoxin family protein [Planctomycetaceae bacterium]